jgi:hypothetical protein
MIGILVDIEGLGTYMELAWCIFLERQKSAEVWHGASVVEFEDSL